MIKLFKGVKALVTSSAKSTRLFSKSTGPDRFANFVVRGPVKDDYEDVVKGTHKFLTVPDANKKKSAESSSEKPTKQKGKNKGKNKETNISKGLSNKDVKKMALELQDYCKSTGYKLAIAGVSSDKHDTQSSKVCGGVGLAMNAKEVLEFEIDDPKWLPRGKYALVCNLWVQLEARRRGIGTGLLEKVIEMAKTEHVKILYSIVDDTKTGPKKVHTDVGFEKVAENKEKKEVLLAKIL